MNSWNQVVTNLEGDVVASREEVEAQNKRIQNDLMNDLYKSSVNKRLILGHVEDLQEVHNQKIQELMELKQLEGYMRHGRDPDNRSKKSFRSRASKREALKLRFDKIRRRDGVQLSIHDMNNSPRQPS